MHSNRIRTAAMAAGVAGALLLVGCGASTTGAAAKASASAPSATGNGVEKLTAAEILSKMQAAATAATSVHVAGKAGTTSIDLVIGKDAADGNLITDAGNIEVVRVATQLYLKGDSAFWTKSANANVAAMVADKYVKVGGDQAAQYSSFTQLSAFFGEALKPDGTVSKGDVSTVDGQRVVALTDDSDGSLLYVLLDGPPFPLKTSKAGTDGGEVDFTDWNKTVTVATPAVADVVDLAGLAGS